MRATIRLGPLTLEHAEDLEALAQDPDVWCSTRGLGRLSHQSLTRMRKHSRLLEGAKLVTTEKVGRVRRCMLAPYAFEGISAWLGRLDRFARVVERTKGER